MQHLSALPVVRFSSCLQQALHALGRPAFIALSESEYPVLHTAGPDGRRVAVVVMWLGDSWMFLWGRNGQASADSPETAAAALTGSARDRTRDNARDNVRDLFSRRPRPRGGRIERAAPSALVGVA